MRRFWIGTSGWNYPHWRERFYPRHIPSELWLPYYAAHFPTVEINNTFYRLPDPAFVERWAAEAPHGFKFAVKASRFLTHIKRLKDCREPLQTFLDRVLLLGGTLGPLLFQLPPQMKRNDDRLADFLRLIPRELGAVFEFRNPSWHVQSVFDLLQSHNRAYCIMDHPLLPRHLIATSDLVYVRFHTAGVEHDHRYTDEQLRWWARALERLSAGRTAWIYFNNDVRGHAIANAFRLAELMDVSLTNEAATQYER